MSRLLKFDRLPNLRDLGGMPAINGKRIREGKLVRSGHLAELSEGDRQKLREMTALIVDLRTDEERSEKPDAAIPGVESVHIPIFDRQVAGITRERSADREAFAAFLSAQEAAERYMNEIYRAFVFNDYSLAQYETFIRLLLERRDGAVLWHCTAGKDRAGVASVILEELLGVPREAIREDYLRTNRCLEGEVEKLTALLAQQSGEAVPAAKASVRALLLAKEEYLDTFYRAVEERFGSFDTYLKDGLYLSQDDIGRVRENYLE